MAKSTLPPGEFWEEELREQAEYQEEWLKKNGAKYNEIYAAVREGRPARLEQFRDKSETEPEPDYEEDLDEEELDDDDFEDDEDEFDDEDDFEDDDDDFDDEEEEDDE